MTIHAFYIFDRHCSCIYSREYNHTQPSQGSVNQNNDSDMAKLLFGIVYSLKNLSAKLGPASPEDSSAESLFPASSNALRSFSTGKYRVHFYESLSSFKFTLVSDLEVENLQPQLWDLYREIFVKQVLQNALFPVEFGASKLNDPAFITLTDKFLSSLPAFV